jgi:hypothetical protein
VGEKLIILQSSAVMPQLMSAPTRMLRLRHIRLCVWVARKDGRKEEGIRKGAMGGWVGGWVGPG